MDRTKPFQFRISAVQQQREWARDELGETLRGINLERTRIAREIDALSANIAAAQELLRVAPSDGSQAQLVDRWRLVHAYTQAQVKETREAQYRQRAAEQEHRECAESLTGAMNDLKAIVKLRERQQELHLAGQETQALRQADDAWLAGRPARAIRSGETS